MNRLIYNLFLTDISYPFHLFILFRFKTYNFTQFFWLIAKDLESLFMVGPYKGIDDWLLLEYPSVLKFLKSLH